MACVTDLEVSSDAATLAGHCRQAGVTFKHLYSIATRPGRASWLSLSDQGDGSCVSISLPGATPRQAIQMMVTAMRALVAAVQAPSSSSGDTRLAAELDPPSLSASVVDALALLLATTASQRHAMQSNSSAQAPPAMTEAVRHTAIGLLSEAGGSLGDVCSVHPQDVVDVVGMDEAGAQLFMQAVHVPGPAAVTLTW
jgi:hypothetical protein